MGHIKNPGKSENQPKKGALDTDEDKSLEKNQTKKDADETEKTEEGTEPQETQEEQAPIEETAAEEETTEAAKEEGVAPEEVEKETEAEITPEEAEEEEKEERPEKAPEEEEIVEERIYTIPLRRAWISPRKRRAPRAAHMVKSFIQRHMKVETATKTGEEEEEGRLVISNEVNEKLWSRGIEKPPRNIRVRAVKDKEGTVTVYLAEGD